MDNATTESFCMALLNQIKVIPNPFVILMTPEAMLLALLENHSPIPETHGDAVRAFMESDVKMCSESRIELEAQRRVDLGWNVIVCKKNVPPYRKEAAHGPAMPKSPDN
jgi:hypothetical protein